MKTVEVKTEEQTFSLLIYIVYCNNLVRNHLDGPLIISYLNRLKCSHCIGKAMLCSCVNQSVILPSAANLRNQGLFTPKSIRQRSCLPLYLFDFGPFSLLRVCNERWMVKHQQVEVWVCVCCQVTCLLHHMQFTGFVWEILDRNE